MSEEYGEHIKCRVCNETVDKLLWSPLNRNNHKKSFSCLLTRGALVTLPSFSKPRLPCSNYLGWIQPILNRVLPLYCKGREAAAPTARYLGTYPGTQAKAQL